MGDYDGVNFGQWENGSIDNPRTFSLTTDTTFTASFNENSLVIKLDPSMSTAAAYEIVVTGQIFLGPNADAEDVLSTDGTTVNGNIWANGQDDFSYTGTIVSITADKPILSHVNGVEVPNQNLQFLEIKSDPTSTSWTSYEVVVSGQILHNTHASIINDVLSPDGTTINGGVGPNGLDGYTYTGTIVSISADKPILSFVNGIEVPNVSAHFLEIKLDPTSTSWTSYEVVVLGQILPGPHANPGDTISPDGTTINGGVGPNGLDDYSYTGTIVSINANQNIISIIDGVEVPNNSPPL